MLKTSHQYFVYIITNKKGGVLYIGVTNNLERRLFEHKNKVNDGFSKKYNLSRLVYFETFNDINEAIRREKNLKKWKRQWKINLIIEQNEQWNDLAIDWYDE